MNPIVTPDTDCPHCGYVIDRATGAGHDATPIVGDLSLCFKCGGLNVFTPSLSLRKPTTAEIVALDAETWAEVKRVQLAISSVVKGGVQ